MRDKQPKKHVLLGIVVALLLLGSGTTAVGLQKVQSEPTRQIATAHSPATKAAMSVANIKYQGVDGKTALELLSQHATVVTKSSSYGPYVDSINGVAGGTDKKYWAFYVNDKMADIGADAYVTKATDKIVWKFE